MLVTCSPSADETDQTVRFAQFNIWELSTEKLSEVDADGRGQNEQLLAAAEIIRRIDPDILLINEIDHDVEAGQDLSLNVRRFIDRFLDQGDEASRYPHIFAAPCNTGILAGFDLDNNGSIATDQDRGSRDHGGDCYGYGVYPGQYAMAILSKYPLQSEKVRTFQNFLWKDLPDNLLPAEWYSQEEQQIFRLSSKSHWDVPVQIGTKLIHFLVSHPTPPGFDGPEDRNGRRNYDEVRMWVHYIDNDSVLVDDMGDRAGLSPQSSFIIGGDLNAALHGAVLDNGERSINQLLDHNRIKDTGELLISAGALNGREPGSPEQFESRTAGWRDRGLRIDYLLPSTDLDPVGGGVFWPDTLADPVGSALAKKASDHRMIWLDIRI